MDPAILGKWIGKTETRTDRIRAEPVNFMEMTLDRAPLLGDGDILPPLWHWLYFLQSVRLGDLERDGHPTLGGFLPPVSLPRRMWAGGRLGFAAPLRIGAMATRVSTITGVRLKDGRSGPLCFVTVRHEVSSGGVPCLWEDHDIVYRNDPAPGDAPPAPPQNGTDWEISEKIRPSEVMLFRYSALTFNGHRIHYDRDYARNVEGHGGLVVHGPLIATFLADLAIRMGRGEPLRAFDYRAISPIFDGQDFGLHARRTADRVELAASRPDGGLAMRARAVF
ncbi:MAG: MaoC family dehydratase N-terminal domain-containing protein [Rhodobacteraceae bacterium]|nr:MaoC family dehydratase N-terminal domain-containing protein [Paracoccaceae bacterium]